MLNVKNTVNWFHLCALPILLISPTLSHADSTTVAFKARSRYLQDGKDVVKTVDVKWSAEKTAVVICDMWSSHWCDSASRRCAEMAPRINAFVSALRSRGVLIIHCPSSGVKHYENTPMRMRAKAAPVVKTEVPLLAWCSLDKTRE